MKKQLEVGSVLSVKEMQEYLGISQSTWSHTKDDLLDNFSMYYDYWVEYKGRKQFYHIDSVKGEYQGRLRKNSKIIRDKAYEDEILEVISYDNIQTPLNVSRIIKDRPSIQEFKHADGTVYENTRLRMHKMFGVSLNDDGTHGQILDKIWCRLDAQYNIYVPIEDDKVSQFYELLRAEKVNQADLDAISIYVGDYEGGNITYEEMRKGIGEIGFSAFLRAKAQFANNNGFYPIKVPIYGIKDVDYYSWSDGKEIKHGDFDF